jgi:hypothetical protein
MEGYNKQLISIIKGQIEIGKTKEELIESLSVKGFKKNEIEHVYDYCNSNSTQKTNKTAIIYLSIGLLFVVVSIASWGRNIGDTIYYWWGGLITGIFFSIIGIIKFKKTSQ